MNERADPLANAPSVQVAPSVEALPAVQDALASSSERPAGLSVLRIIVYLTLHAVWPQLPWPQDPVLLYYGNAILRLVFLVGLGLLLTYRRKPSALMHYCFGRPIPSGRSLAVLPLLLLGVVGARAAADYLLRPTVAYPPTPQNLLGQCCLTPLNEEFVFRGVFLAVLLAHPQLSHAGAVLLSAMVFTSVHFPIPGQILPLLGLGVFLGFVFYWTRCVLICVACHAAWNAGCFWSANYWS